MRSVTTVGATRTDGLWIGSSSQGPAVPGFASAANRKPNVGAPAHFCEPNDASLRNTGTSTAVAMTAGVLAAARSVGGLGQGVAPADMRAALEAGARRFEAPDRTTRAGAGVINAKGLLASLRG